MPNEDILLTLTLSNSLITKPARALCVPMHISDELILVPIGPPVNSHINLMGKLLSEI